MAISKRGMYSYDRRRRRPIKFTWALNEQQSVTLNAAGTGTISLIPGGARERWLVTLINTSAVLTTLTVPILRVYRGNAMPANQLGGTYTGNLDTNSTDQWLLNMNEGLVFQYTNGAVGDVATIRIEGTKYVWDWG